VAMNNLSLAMLAGASVVAAMFATQPAFADKASEMSVMRRTCLEGAAQVRINGCTRMIQSGFFAGDELTDAFYFRSAAYFELGQHQRAIEDVSRAIARKPDYEQAFFARGASYLMLKQLQPAIQDFNKVIALKPNDAAAFFSRGTAYLQLTQYQQAIPDFDRSITLRPDGVTFNNRGYCYFQLGQFQKAIEDYDRAIALTPGSARILYIRGIAKLRSDDKPGGNADIAAAVALEPKIAEQYAALGVKP
jgi:tetratricopeptide (TPR) repeat protein